MQRCYNSAVRMPKEPWLCCYGAPGCTAAPSSQETTPSAVEDTSTGVDPKQASGSELRSHNLNLELSPSASMQDLYLLLRGLCDGGFAVSVTVQATPSKPSLPSLLGIAEQCGCSTKVCPCTEWLLCWGVLIPHLSATTPSSKQSASSDSKELEERVAVIERYLEEDDLAPDLEARIAVIEQWFLDTFKEGEGVNVSASSPNDSSKKGCLGKLQEGKE